MIDLRSDTVTQPTDDMRKAMANAIVGDDVYLDDPTTSELEVLAAKLTGKEAAVFVPSGTMANQLAVMAHTKRGDEIILGANSHIVAHEVGGASVLSGVSYGIVSHPNDWVTAEAIKKAYREDDIHYPDTGLVCLENALGNGMVVPLDVMKDAYNAAKELNLPVHLDGARLFNAATSLGVDAKDITQYCDTVMFCVSKGLCAPVGSLLCGDAKFVIRAKKLRKLLGGGMRQSGILAAAGIIGLNEMTKRLHIDHENAKYLATELSKIDGITVDIDRVHISMVFCDITEAVSPTELVKYMLDNNVKMSMPEIDTTYRFVTHNWISKEDIDTFISLLRKFMQ
jgi:threonine aldolase